MTNDTAAASQDEEAKNIVIFPDDGEKLLADAPPATAPAGPAASPAAAPALTGPSQGGAAGGYGADAAKVQRHASEPTPAELAALEVSMVPGGGTALRPLDSLAPQSWLSAHLGLDSHPQIAGAVSSALSAVAKSPGTQDAAHKAVLSIIASLLGHIPGLSSDGKALVGDAAAAILTQVADAALCPPAGKTPGQAALDAGSQGIKAVTQAAGPLVKDAVAAQVEALIVPKVEQAVLDAAGKLTAGWTKPPA